MGNNHVTCREGVVWTGGQHLYAGWEGVSGQSGLEEEWKNLHPHSQTAGSHSFSGRGGLKRDGEGGGVEECIANNIMYYTHIQTHLSYCINE